VNDFELASRQSAACVALIQVVTDYGKAGHVDGAYRNLASLNKQLAECGPVIAKFSDQLAAQSDSPVQLGNTYWSSAHAAAIGISRSILEGLFYPAVSDIEWGEIDINAPMGLKRNQVNDPHEQRRRAEQLLAERWQEFRLEPGRINALQERIRRERAKLLAKNNLPVEVKASWIGDGKVQIGDDTITLESQLADVLQALVELRSATMPELQTKSGRDEPDKLLKKLVKKFPALKPFIRFPGGRGKGGYSTTIQLAAN
jgi:hypothetical protein